MLTKFKAGVAIFLCICLIPVFGFGGGPEKYAVAAPGSVFNLSPWAESEFDLARGYGLLPEAVFFTDYTAPISRVNFCEIIVLLYEKLEGREYLPQRPNPFADADNLSVRKAYELGLVSGVAADRFAPWANLTRQEAAVILVNLMAARGNSLVADEGILNGFADAGGIASWAAGAVAVLLSGGYMQGTGDGAFSPLAEVSTEQAVLLATRYFLNNNPGQGRNRVMITAPADGSTLPYEDLRLVWSREQASAAEDYIVYLYNAGTATRLLDQRTTENSLVLPKGGAIPGEGEYYLVVESGDKVFSKPARVYLGERSVRINYKDSLKPDSAGRINLSWQGVAGAYDYVVEIQETRDTYNENVRPAPLRQEYTGGAASCSLRANLYCKYEIKVSALDGDGRLCGIPDTAVVYGGYPDYYGERAVQYEELAAINSQETADAAMRTIEVRVWKMDRNGNKTPSTATLTVYNGIAALVTDAFEEIFNGPEQFPVKDLGAYNWRAPMSSGRLSAHNYGLAIDINANENYCIYSDGTTIGTCWAPYEDPYSITPYGDVINAFEKRGFIWGGDAWGNPHDYMHFEY